MLAVTGLHIVVCTLLAAACCACRWLVIAGCLLLLDFPPWFFLAVGTFACGYRIVGCTSIVFVMDFAVGEGIKGTFVLVDA